MARTTPTKKTRLGGKHLAYAALGALLWGAAKAVQHARHSVACPACVARLELEPARLLTHVVTGPLMEEVAFRGAMQRQLGLVPTSVVFGAGHVASGVSLLENAAKVADATLGGVLYGLVADGGGIAASTLVHGAHNLGVSLGNVWGARRGAAGHTCGYPSSSSWSSPSHSAGGSKSAPSPSSSGPS